jgi:Tfp pilus assembly protein PilF
MLRWILRYARPTARDYLLLARGFLGREDLARAREEVEKARGLSPDSAEAVLLLAHIFQQQEGPQKKVELLSDYREAFGAHVEVTRQLASALLATGDHERARSLMEEVLESAHPTAQDYLLLARIQRSLLNFHVSKRFIEKARKVEPNNPECLRLLGALMHQTQGLHAKAQILKCAEIDPETGSSLLLDAIETHICINQKETARLLARKINKKMLHDNQLLQLASLLEAVGEKQEALTCHELLSDTGPYSFARALIEKTGEVNSQLWDKGYIECVEHRKNGNIFQNALWASSLAEYPQKKMEQKISPLEWQASLERFFEPSYLRATTQSDTAPLVSIVAPIHRPEDVVNLQTQLARQSYPRIEVIVVINGDGIDLNALKANLVSTNSFERVEVFDLGQAASLATSLNFGNQNSMGEYIARFDADDIYLENYLNRSIAMMQSHTASICSRSHLFIHLSSINSNIISARHRYYTASAPMESGHGSGSSLIISRKIAECVSYDESLGLGEDFDFYNRIKALGARAIYAPPFDHVVIRKSDKSSHTWKAADVLLLARPGSEFLMAGTTESFLKTLNRLLENTGVDAVSRT